MAGNRELFEKKSVFRAVLSLALPSVAGQIILVIYAMADTFFVGRTGSSAAITAVTVCTPAFMFLSAVSNLFGVGGAGVISRFLGIGKMEAASRASAFAFWGCLLTTFLYCLLGFLFRDGFIDLLGGTDLEVHACAVEYFVCTVVIGGEATAIGALFAHLVRSNGFSLCAGIGTALGGICNIFLDPLFMFVLLPAGNEVRGAAIATALSNFIALFYFVFVLLRRRNRFFISLAPSSAMLRERIPTDIFLTGFPACIMTLFENISFAVLDSIMAFSGIQAQAGLGIAKKVNMLAHCIVRGIAQGVLPLIGFNYSAGNFKRMRSALRISASAAVGTAVLCSAACLLFGRELTGLFAPGNPLSVFYATGFLKILCLGAPFSACAYIVISFFQAVGRGARSCILALMRKGILDIPLMFLLQRFLPLYGSVSATPITDLICCIAALILLRLFINRSLKERSQIPEAMNSHA